MAKQPKTYTAPHPVYTGGKLYAANEPFVTDQPAGDEWKTVGEQEKAAFDAANYQTSDSNFDDLTLSELRAVAAIKGVTVIGNRKTVLAAVKAAFEPAL